MQVANTTSESGGGGGGLSWLLLAVVCVVWVFEYLTDLFRPFSYSRTAGFV